MNLPDKSNRWPTLAAMGCAPTNPKDFIEADELEKKMQNPDYMNGVMKTMQHLPNKGGTKK